MKTKKCTHISLPDDDLKTVIGHIIKEELNLQVGGRVLTAAAEDFNALGLDSYIDIVNARQKTTKSHNSKYLLAAIEDLVDEEYLPALKQKLIKRIMDKILADAE